MGDFMKGFIGPLVQELIGIIQYLYSIIAW